MKCYTNPANFYTNYRYLKTKPQNTFNKYRWHLLIWGLFILYEVVVVAVLKGDFSSAWDYIGHYSLNISLFYFHAWAVAQLAHRNEQHFLWLIPLLVLAELSCYIALNFLLEYILTNYLQVELMRPFEFDYYYWIRATWRGIYFLGFSTGYFFLRNYLREHKRAELAEKQHLLKIIEKKNLQHELIKSQNAYLKTQINPHFLFNTLNFVYNSVRKTSSEAAEAILALSQMMRYALQNEDDQSETVLLEEIEHVESLISIHQIRHKHQLQVHLNYTDNLAGVKFIPLVLITLVENLFKHGNLTHPVYPAQISITLEVDILQISTTNLIGSTKTEGHRIGLDNIQKRLLQAYGNRASFSATASEKGIFFTEVKVLSPSLPPMLPSAS